MKKERNTEMENFLKSIIYCSSDCTKMKKEFITPHELKKASDYINDYYGWLKKLENSFVENNVDVDYVGTVKEYAKNIKVFFREYFSGNIINALETLKRIMTPLFKENSIAVSTIEQSIAFNDLDIINEKQKENKKVYFFRSRKSNSYKVFNGQEMLHVPFDKREKVEPTRFSINGMPCLYLATSSYCCWLEARFPPDYSFNVSYVELNTNPRILNLVMNSEMICSMISMVEKNNFSIDVVKDALLLWMLTYGTSYKIDDDTRPFKIEYVLSQSIMLVCLEKGLDGVAYYSKRLDDDRLAYMNAVNLALFANYNENANYSLKYEGIKVTPSYNYAMYKQLGNIQKYCIPDDRIFVDYGSGCKKIGNYERYVEYNETEFYSFDRFLVLRQKDELKPVDLTAPKN